MTHGALAIRALDAKHPDDKAPSDQYKRFVLATKIGAAAQGETVDLTIEEAASVKDAVGKLFPPGLFGQIWMAIDEAAKAPAAKPNGVHPEGAAAH